MRNARVYRRGESLGFALRLQVRVPEYVVDNVLLDDHYEGSIFLPIS